MVLKVYQLTKINKETFGNTNLPPRQREVIKTLEEMGGITTENANKLISQYKGMLEICR